MKINGLREFLKVQAEEFTTKYKCTPREAYIEGGQWTLEHLWHNTTPTEYTIAIVEIKAILKNGKTLIGPRLATYIPSFKKLGNEPWVIHYQAKDDFEEVEILKWLDLNDINIDFI